MNEQPGQAAVEALIAEGVSQANIPALLLLTVQLTGDTKWLREPYALTKAQGMDDNDTGGLSPALQADVRAAALGAILDWRAGKPIAVPDPTAEEVVRFMTWAMCDTIPESYGPLLRDMLAGGFASETFEKFEKLPAGFDVLIIGASISGLCAAAFLKNSGIPFRIFEMNDNVGGSWLINRYPGCGVDVGSHYYSFGFTNYDWSAYFALRDEIFDYIQTVARDIGVMDKISFNDGVKEIHYQEDRQEWLVSTRKGETTAKIVISAVGVFFPPKMANISGMESFKGDLFHTADWPEGLDLRGKRVALIGNGASAMQIGPEIQRTVASLTVYQRSPHWILPFPLFRKAVPDGLRALIREVPLYLNWYRTRIAWKTSDGQFPYMVRDPEWDDQSHAINAQNDEMRKFLTAYLKTELGDRQDLIDKVLPSYPVFGKRILRDNGWYKMLLQPNVSLVNRPITRIVEDGIETADGTTQEFDIIVVATGYDATRFLSTYNVYGRSGQKLREVWDDDNGRAYLGAFVPGFPNFFMLYGPNIQAGHGGSLMYIVELQMHYIMDLIHKMLAEDTGAVDIKQQVFDAYNDRVDRQHETMIWTHPGTSTYYRNDRGRVVVIYPFRYVDMHQATRAANLDEFDLEPARAFQESS